jgi:spore coat protein JB
MNNYPDFKNFDYPNSFMNNFMNLTDEMNMYNQNNNSYNMKSDNNLYDPYNGLIRGNLFKNLYVPYKEREPYDIKPMNEQARMLTDIDALGFAMVDLNLYLDINPNDRDALNLFNKYRREKETKLKEYESKYGPITLNSESLNSFPWSWDDMPWPWDN